TTLLHHTSPSGRPSLRCFGQAIRHEPSRACLFGTIVRRSDTTPRGQALTWLRKLIETSYKSWTWDHKPAMLSALIGNPAPRFDLPCTRFPDPSRTRVALEDYRGRWLLLLFYPRDFSLICPTELIGMSQHFEEFEKHHCEILGIGCDPVDL